MLLQLCGRKLRCGNHLCPSPCHAGPCQPCPLTVPIACACGQTSYNTPCGTESAAKPPKCPEVPPPNAAHAEPQAMVTMFCAGGDQGTYGHAPIRILTRHQSAGLPGASHLRACSTAACPPLPLWSMPTLHPALWRQAGLSLLVPAVLYHADLTGLCVMQNTCNVCPCRTSPIQGVLRLGNTIHGLTRGCVMLAELRARLLCQMSPPAASAHTGIQGASAACVAWHPAHQGQEAHSSMQATGSRGEHA